MLYRKRAQRTIISYVFSELQAIWTNTLQAYLKIHFWSQRKQDHSEDLYLKKACYLCYAYLKKDLCTAYLKKEILYCLSEDPFL